MIVKRNGGMTEFIPSPREKREGLIRDHILELVNLLHERVTQIEQAQGLAPDQAEQCRELLGRIQAEERQTQAINRQMAEEFSISRST